MMSPRSNAEVDRIRAELLADVDHSVESIACDLHSKGFSSIEIGWVLRHVFSLTLPEAEQVKTGPPVDFYPLLRERESQVVSLPLKEAHGDKLDAFIKEVNKALEGPNYALDYINLQIAYFEQHYATPSELLMQKIHAKEIEADESVECWLRLIMARKALFET